MRQGYSPEEACKTAISHRIVNKPGSNYQNFQVGYIAINKNGDTGSYAIQKGFDMTKYDKDGNQNISSLFFDKKI